MRKQNNTEMSWKQSIKLIVGTIIASVSFYCVGYVTGIGETNGLLIGLIYLNFYDSISNENKKQ